MTQRIVSQDKGLTARSNSRNFSLRLASGLSHTTYSAGRARRTLTLIAALILLAAAPKMGRSQAIPDIVFDGTNTDCGDGCCLEFTEIITEPTTTTDIYMISNGSGTDCFTHSCWTGQTSGTKTFQEGSDYSDFQIVANAFDRMWTGPFPYSFNVYICGSYDCLKNYTEYNWYMSSIGGSRHNNYPLYMQSCETFPGCSTGCSYITVNQDGTDAANCGTLICFFNQSGFTVGSFTLNFDPPINLSTRCIDLVTGDTQTNCFDYSFDHSFSSWSWSAPDPYGNVTFTGGSVATCGPPICVFIPACATTYNDASLVNEVVSLVDPVNPPGCSTDNSVVSVAMKQPDGGSGTTQSNRGQQNYPNPVDAASGFNTTIPFVTSTGGTAVITISDEKGTKVLNDDEEILGAGGHFFYFSAKDLPSGTYYYTIEFPQGVVIANKTMIVVK